MWSFAHPFASVPIKMVVRIRMQRFGRKNLPFYRIVVADSRSPRDGRFIEKVIAGLNKFERNLTVIITFTQVGTYNPIANKDNIKEITANTDRIRYWLSCGAQPSERVGWLFGRIGLLPDAPVRQSVQEAIPKVLRPKK